MNRSTRIVIPFLIILFLSCNNSNEATVKPPASHDAKLNPNLDFIWDAKSITRDSISDIMDLLCDSITYEIIDLYPGGDSIPKDDWFILDDTLKMRGFKVVETGRGNWDKGPRIITMTLETNSCICRLDKLYYSQPSHDRVYRVTERFACRRK